MGSSGGIRTPATAHGYPAGIQRGMVSRTGARSGELVVTDGTTEVDAYQITVAGGTVTELAAGIAQIRFDTADALVPSSTITATKDSGNPTFNFDAVPENVVKVGSTYYCPYMDNTGISAVFKLATATDRDGPWSAGSTIYTVASVPWLSGADGIYSPFIIEDSSTFYLFYAGIVSGGPVDAKNAIGYATATAITGPYTDHGAAVLNIGAGAAWDSRRVAEPSIVIQAGVWVMAYMGETSASTYQTSEKVGIATAPGASGPWTKAALNPVIGFGTSGAWDDALIADPHIFYEGGTYWIWYCGAPDSNPSTQIDEGFAYATDATGPYTRHASNPILSVGTSGTWDDVWAFRGGLWLEDGEWGGVYTGFSGTQYRGGNFRLSITSTQTVDLRAVDIPIDDAGGYYTGTEVEAALQEIGATLASSTSGTSGHMEVVVSGSAPPVAVETSDRTDWVYGFVPD